MLSGDMLQLMSKDDIYDVAVRFYDYIPLDSRWIFDSTTPDDLSCEIEMEEIILGK